MKEPIDERVLLVDDDPSVLDGLCRQHRKHFQLQPVPGPEPALRLLAEGGNFAVVVSDYQMPGMNGATFLSKVREIAPDMSRIMLTGQADMTTAVDAVNRGNILRFLTKPCDPELFRTVVEAGLKQFRLIRAERSILEQTVQGAVGMLTDILALAQPAAFGRARRIHQYASHVVDALHVEDAWQVQTAALLSQVGCVAVPNDILDRVSRGEHLPTEQAAMLDRHPRLAAELIQRIPRLQGVAEIIAAQTRSEGRGRPQDPELRLGAAILAAAIDFEELISMGARPAQAIEAMRKTSSHPERILEVLATASPEGRPAAVMVVNLGQLRPGMILCEEVRGENGMLLVSKGHVVTVGSLQRLRNYTDHGLLRHTMYRVHQPQREQGSDVSAA